MYRRNFRHIRLTIRQGILLHSFGLALMCSAFGGTGEVLQLGSQRELFVDRHFIGSMDGLELRLHEPRREGVALKFDRPWEGGFSCYTTVIKDGDTYRMYYRGLPSATRDDSPEATVCYAESRDGITWTKPDLGLFTVQGT